MNTTELITKRFNEILEKAKEAYKYHYNSSSIGSYIQGSFFREWTTSALHLLKTAFGENNIHYEHLKQVYDKFYGFNHEFNYALSIFKAAKEDFDSGIMFNLEDRIAGDIFNDFLEMAEYLLENGHKDPAAMLGGAVLEDGLRKIAKKHNITVKRDDDIGSLNTKITDSHKSYNNIVRKQIQTWKDIRDKADHCHFNEYDSSQVKYMIDGVRDTLFKFM